MEGATKSHIQIFDVNAVGQFSTNNIDYIYMTLNQTPYDEPHLKKNHQKF